MKDDMEIREDQSDDILEMEQALDLSYNKDLELYDHAIEMIKKIRVDRVAKYEADLKALRGK